LSVAFRCESAHSFAERKTTIGQLFTERSLVFVGVFILVSIVTLSSHACDVE